VIGTILGTVAIIAVAIAIGVVVDRKIDLLPRPEKLAEPRPKLPGHAAGEAPATAIRAGGAQRATLRATQRCKACRTVLVADGDDDHVRYDDRELVVILFRCPNCGVKRALYVM
jgi:hypothetical protein